MPDLTLQEIEEKVMAAKPWKAPGEDGLPAIVWKKLWHVVKHRIIPLRKPDKGDYTMAKAWRPISLLSTLGKILEANARKDESRGIPSRLVKWIDAFCSGRTASVVVNGHTSEQQPLPQAGLPQGSPLSPVAFLFFNADLVQRRIKSNRDEKTSVIHFTRITERNSDLPLIIKGNDVKPKNNVKLLGVIMDKALRFKEHIARAAAKGLAAAMCLKRLRMASPRTARQLFVFEDERQACDSHHAFTGWDDTTYRKWKKNNAAEEQEQHQAQLEPIRVAR
ncbi:reverse transcriptase (RNA-dependent DNA polymerase) [Hirsutella rhossiliensis]|uniref:Reverse transcriptase (RNA-dependent DNA polymerase) domain-containing protein n=1 Tax=Hirsutella rhossiliensis TaxID=111463 RepID=A0A9P8MU50_9HYPO|nr:reverse transcriptase (RNA-dependent DNA polymerase) domain-containing protein [Hirsutella rhossiliensis]KAH0959247.1 reverse transcriptase (RNA-dependent DNA polymerase) domain-containing protein [Hirsutella rhossiliensis]